MFGSGDNFGEGIGKSVYALCISVPVLLLAVAVLTALLVWRW